MKNMKYNFPNYDKSLLSLVSSIENHYGIKMKESL